jgi:late competence protein required for DNA uptake (superfamily II DNA/RNA helicase)
MPPKDYIKLRDSKRKKFICETCKTVGKEKEDFCHIDGKLICMNCLLTATYSYLDEE